MWLFHFVQLVDGFFDLDDVGVDLRFAVGLLEALHG